MSVGPLKSSGVQFYYRELELKRKDDVWDSCEKVGKDSMAHVEQDKAQERILGVIPTFTEQVEQKNQSRKHP